MKLSREQIAEILKVIDADPLERVLITCVSGGVNIRIKEKKVIDKQTPFIEILRLSGMQVNFCKRCVRGNYGTETIVHLHGHHIIPKSAGGKDDIENGIVLCDKCHADLHASRWHIVSVIGSDSLEKLRKKYKVRYGVLHD